ncbi:MAG: hypothetical protein EAZ61_13115 [Oscillatoriales cyanobacterium]|nr:MAG: hypothetical protein EAZ61_13115 [Oscillatoriales cyanobacterium]
MGEEGRCLLQSICEEIIMMVGNAHPATLSLFYHYPNPPTKRNLWEPLTLVDIGAGDVISKKNPAF